MKRFLSLLFVGVSILLFAGCDQKSTEPVSNNNSQNNTTVETKKSETIDMEKAKKIALDDAGCSEGNVTDLSVELDNNENKFEVGFKYNGKDYDYDIDSSNGKIIKKDVDIDD